ncbi:MAG: epoxyqueuosine reductase QueH [Treponema sp.]|nr:epoxyqueuosine reductase QueH [Treponema sp.]
MKLLLHCCCAPCSVSCVKALREEKIEPEIFFYNPNIHPFTEYKARRDCLKLFADNEKLKTAFIEKDYGLELFLRETSNTFNEQARNAARCEICYSTRLEKTAVFAAENGYSAFTTTLLISPYQNHEAIIKTAKDAAIKHKIDFLYRDFRPLFREGQAASRARGLYAQKYCGCIFSEEERYIKKKKNHTEISSPAPSRLSEGLFSRISLLIGNDNLEKLKNTKALIFGAGGVGSWAAEALARSGVGNIGIIDNDIVLASNINRQTEATSLTLGKFKALCLKTRLLEINPECQVTSYNKLFSRENENEFNIEKADYVIDAIDTINHKLDLIEKVITSGVTLYSSMGMALKLDPSLIKISSIWKTKGCPLARLVRQGLKKRGFKGDFTAVYSDEEIKNHPPVDISSALDQDDTPSDNKFLNASSKKRINGSIVTVTASAGLLLASLVIRDIIGENQDVLTL